MERSNIVVPIPVVPVAPDDSHGTLKTTQRVELMEPRSNSCHRDLDQDFSGDALRLD